MARILYTTEDLVSGVRSLIDESNQDAVDDYRDIIPSLRRALTYGANTLARRYPEPLLTYSTLELQAGVSEYEVPEDAFEDRILKVEIVGLDGAGSSYYEVERISYRNISAYDVQVPTDVPAYYCTIGRRIRFVSTPSGTNNARIWYLRQPEKLVSTQGRITHIGVNSSDESYIRVQDIDTTTLSTEVDDLDSYVNLVDGQTGEIRCTLQVRGIDGSRITFRTTPLRSRVLNRDVVGQLPENVEVDDYICNIEGTCVPPSSAPLINFIIEYTTAEMVGKLGGDRGLEEQVLQKFEKQLERSWVGRERKTVVQKSSHAWVAGGRKFGWGRFRGRW